MVSDWKVVSLGDVAKIQGGYAFKSKDFTETGIPVVKIKNVRKRDVDLADVARVSQDIAEKASSFLIKSWDVLISMTGSGPNAPASIVGRVARHSGEDDVFLINQRVGRFLIKEEEQLDQRFLYYLFSEDKTQLELLSIATGSANQVNISGKQIESIEVNLPPLPEQKAIAHILGSLDDKIELNRQMNETLEAMAQALFKSWFVDFDPVIDNALAAGNAIPDELLEPAEKRKGIEKKNNSDIQDLFPDTFEFTEEMGWIPKGWEVRKLKSICRVLNGRAYKNTEFKEQGTPIVRIQNLSRSGKTVYSDLDLPEDKIICTEDFLYAWSATFGPHIWRGPKSIYHYHIWKMDVDESIVSRYFLYLAMFRKTESMKNAGTGSIFTHLTKKIMEGQDILIGDEKVNTAFSNQVTVIFKKITKLDEENNSLSKIRDTLLPKLMSGELLITDAAAMVEEV